MQNGSRVTLKCRYGRDGVQQRSRTFPHRCAPSLKINHTSKASLPCSPHPYTHYSTVERTTVRSDIFPTVVTHQAPRTHRDFKVTSHLLSFLVHVAVHVTACSGTSSLGGGGAAERLLSLCSMIKGSSYFDLWTCSRIHVDKEYQFKVRWQSF